MTIPKVASTHTRTNLLSTETSFQTAEGFQNHDQDCGITLIIEERDYFYTQEQIAQQLWMNSEIKISNETRKKVEIVRKYANEQGFNLRGVKADGNCFVHAFWGSYCEVRSSTTTDARKSTPVKQLREQIVAQIKQSSRGKTDRERAEKILEDGVWIYADREGDLLAKVYKIPIRVVTVEMNGELGTVVDLLTFVEDRGTQEWEKIKVEERPSEYVFIVDLGMHFIFASRHTDAEEASKTVKKSTKRFFAEIDQRNEEGLESVQIPRGKKTHTILPGPKSTRKRPNSGENNELQGSEQLTKMPKKEKGEAIRESHEAKNGKARQEDSNKIQTLEREWQEYRLEFAHKHLRLESEKNDSIDWTAFRERLRNYYTQVRDVCAQYDKNQLGPNSYWQEWELHTLVVNKYNALGAISLLDHKLPEAINAFQEAIAIGKDHLKSWLFLASALYGAKRYQEVIHLFEKYRRTHRLELLDLKLGPKTTPWDEAFAFYSYFTLLSDDCIDGNGLQLTHPMYIDTEVLYYCAKAMVAIQPSDSRLLGQVFFRRAIECAQHGYFSQALVNFEKAQPLVPDVRLNLWYPVCLFRLGEIDRAIKHIENALKVMNDKKKRSEYLFNLIDICLLEGEDGQIEFLLKEVEILDKSEWKNLDFLRSVYYQTWSQVKKGKPYLPKFLQLIGQFFAQYKKLAIEERLHQATTWLIKISQLRTDICEIYIRTGQISKIIEVHKAFLEHWNGLTVTLEKSLIQRRKFESEKIFPNVMYDWLYFEYLGQQLSQASDWVLETLKIRKESLDVTQSKHLTIEYENVIKTIGKKVENFVMRKFLIGGNIKPLENEYQQLLRSVQKLKNYYNLLPSEETPSSDDELLTFFSIEKLTNPENVTDRGIQAIYDHHQQSANMDFACDAQIAIQEHVARTHLYLGLIQWKFEVVLVYPGIALEGDVDKVQAILQIINNWLQVIELYESVIGREQHRVVKKGHEEGLLNYKIIVFVNLADQLLTIAKSFGNGKNTGVHRRCLELGKDIFSKIENTDKESLLPISKERFQDLQKRVDFARKMLVLNPFRVNLNLARQEVKELKEQIKENPLDFWYSDGSPSYLVKFPQQQILNAIEEAEKTKPGQHTNISAHYLTVIYTESKEGNERKTLHIPLNSELQNQTILPKSEENYMLRMRNGKKILESVSDPGHLKLREAFPREDMQLNSFDNYLHKHSEQVCFEWLARKDLTVIENGMKQIKPGSKVLMVAFDVGSVYDSCIHCRLSALSMQSQEGFLSDFENKLKEHKYELPKEESGIRLKAVTRILYKTIRKSAKLHVNPATKDLEQLKNLGIFQERYDPTKCFASGSQQTNYRASSYAFSAPNLSKQ